MSSLEKQHRFILLTIDGPRDVAVKEYSTWPETNVIDENLRAQFQLACDVTLANGLDLEQIHEDQNPESFLVQEGIAVGIARRFVGDIIKSILCSGYSGSKLVFDDYASMPEMADCTLFPKSYSLDTSLKEIIEPLPPALFIPSPVTPDERLQLREKLFDGI
ncbi:unnamed protein product [Penicillium pancosmium]